jgi:hypothetical protein
LARAVDKSRLPSSSANMVAIAIRMVLPISDSPANPLLDPTWGYVDPPRIQLQVRGGIQGPDGEWRFAAVQAAACLCGTAPSHLVRITP